MQPLRHPSHGERKGFCPAGVSTISPQERAQQAGVEAENKASKEERLSEDDRGGAEREVGRGAQLGPCGVQKLAPALREGRSGVAWAREESAERMRGAVSGLDYMHTRSEQEKEEAKGMPIVVAKDDRTKMITAKVVPSKG